MRQLTVDTGLSWMGWGKGNTELYPSPQMYCGSDPWTRGPRNNEFQNQTSGSRREDF